MTTPTPPKRPGRNDPAVIAAAAKALAVKVQRWLQSCDDAAADPEEIESQLSAAIRWNDDGYRIARQLDSQGWDADAELVEILNDAVFIKRDHHRKAEVEWVKASGIKAPDVGAAVTFKQLGMTVEGVITRNDEDGKSVVFCASLGHVREGTGVHGTIIEWENLTPITTT